MLARLYHALAIVSIATVFALNGLFAYLSASGRLGGGRAQAIAALLRGETVHLGAASEPPVQKGADVGEASGGQTLAQARSREVPGIDAEHLNGVRHHRPQAFQLLVDDRDELAIP